VVDSVFPPSTFNPRLANNPFTGNIAEKPNEYDSLFVEVDDDDELLEEFMSASLERLDE